MERISMISTSDYELEMLRKSVRLLLEPLGGIGRFVKPGQRVLLKPNMLAARPPEAAVTTHPSVLQVVAELAKEAGGIVTAGDSPGIGSFEKVAIRSRIMEAAAAGGVVLLPFRETVSVKGGKQFRNLQLSSEYMNADVVINLPKLKTHEMMTMTCAVKNLYGSVVGPAKAALHLTAGRSKGMFAALLLEIADARPVALTIVDAVVAMEGDGPNSGTAREAGWLIAGENPVAVDVVAGRLAGIAPAILPVELEAVQRGIYGSLMEDIEICGDVSKVPDIRPFVLPSGLDVQFGIPGFIGDILRRHISPLPEADRDKCVLCGICRDACPPGAIEINKNALKVSSGRCIRCWCCRELCPHHAMLVKKGFLLKLVERISR